MILIERNVVVKLQETQMTIILVMILRRNLNKMSTILRKEIRNAIIILTQRDPQDNFTILEDENNKVKVEILWTKNEKEVIIINLIENYEKPI